MKKVVFTGIVTLLIMQAAAQKIVMRASNWQCNDSAVEFVTYKSHPAMHILNSNDMAELKNVRFSNGTIEFDWAPEDPNFAGIYFRQQDKMERECFYLRVSAAQTPGSMTAVQYAPFVKGVNLWDLYPHYQSGAKFKAGEWNHIKLVISGRTMQAFVNDMNMPALNIPWLEGDTGAGSIAFDGKGYVANLVVKEEMLNISTGVDPTYNDPRYLRDWSVSQPVPLPAQQEPYYATLPAVEATYKPIAAEWLGLINLTRIYGGSRERRMVYLKTKLHTEKEQDRQVALGFSDEIWVYVNGRPVYVDKNIFGRPLSKQPGGRCSIENASFKLPLQKGDNEIVVILANNFYGWGLIARLDTMEGIAVVKD